MHFYSVNYKKQRGGVPGALVDRGFWWHLPRRPLICALRGHKPIVDGTPGNSPGGHGYRWVACDRCGIRPVPQGSFAGIEWAIGERITLPLQATLGVKQKPGNWPAADEGTIGGQLIIGGQVTAGLEVKVGNAGSEHVLAASACLPWIGGLYLHTEGFGTWLQRRLNPVGYDSRVTGVHVHNGRVWWQVWAKRDHERGAARWREGNARVDPRDILLGEARYSYTDAAGPEAVLLTMPDGTSHAVRMRLQQQVHGREKGWRRTASWVVNCDCRDGIPYRSDGNFHGEGVNGWSVPVGDAAVEGGAWLAEAAAATISKVTEMRIRYRYRPAAKEAA